MPTLFRFFSFLAVAIGIGYAAMFALVHFMHPEQREITQVVSLPGSVQPLTTGRSAAVELDKAASFLTRRAERRRMQ